GGGGAPADIPGPGRAGARGRTVGKGPVGGVRALPAAVFVQRDAARNQPRFPLHGIGSIIIVVVGHLGATISAFPFDVTRNVPKYVGKAMRPQEIQSATSTIEQIVALTSRARTEGILALDEESKGIEDPFFRKGIELAVDGTDPDALRHTLHAEIAAMRDRHKVGQ